MEGLATGKARLAISNGMPTRQWRGLVADGPFPESYSAGRPRPTVGRGGAAVGQHATGHRRGGGCRASDEVDSPIEMLTLRSLSPCRSLITAGLVERFRVVAFPVVPGATGQDRVYYGYPDLRLDLVERAAPSTAWLRLGFNDPGLLAHRAPAGLTGRPEARDTPLEGSDRDYGKH
jgi:hypothetical protein